MTICYYAYFFKSGWTLHCSLCSGYSQLKQISPFNASVTGRDSAVRASMMRRRFLSRYRLQRLVTAHHVHDKHAQLIQTYLGHCVYQILSESNENYRRYGEKNIWLTFLLGHGILGLYNAKMQNESGYCFQKL